MKFVVPVLWGHEESFNGVTPFEVHLDPKIVACPFEPFPKSVCIWCHYGDIFAVCSIVVGLVACGYLSIMGDVFVVELFCRLLGVHVGKLQACRTFLVCSISLCSAC